MRGGAIRKGRMAKQSEWMTTDHTRKPWLWVKNGDDYVLWGNHGHRPIVLDCGSVNGKPMGRKVLRSNMNGIMRPFDPGHPDARLIVEAPAMYELLKSTMYACPSKVTYEEAAGLIARIDGVTRV